MPCSLLLGMTIIKSQNFFLDAKKGRGGWSEAVLSSFFGTSLSSVLASLGCDSTILYSYLMSGCVRAAGKSIS